MGKGNSKLSPDELEYLCSQECTQELQDWQNAFLHDFPSGFITQAQFQEIYGQVFPGKDAVTFSAHVFRSFDSNHDGQLDFREYIFALLIMTRGTMEQKLRWAFNLYDLDGNGYIQRQEMIDIFTVLYQMSDDKSNVPPDEDTPQKKTDKIFCKMDKNKDGKLSLEEFLEGARSDHSILQILQLDPGPQQSTA